MKQHFIQLKNTKAFPLIFLWKGLMEILYPKIMNLFIQALQYIHFVNVDTVYPIMGSPPARQNYLEEQNACLLTEGLTPTFLQDTDRCSDFVLLCMYEKR